MTASEINEYILKIPPACKVKYFGIVSARAKYNHDSKLLFK